MQSSDEEPRSLTKEVNIELPFYPSHLRFVHGGIRAVVFETRAVQVCRENTLHMQHAPTGGARPTGRLSDLRHGARPNPQTVSAWRKKKTIQRRWWPQNQILQIDHDGG